MGDLPNRFYIPRYSSTTTAPPAATEQLSQQPHHSPNHRHQVPFPEIPIPYFSFHPHHAFVSDPQFDFLSHPFHAAACSPLPFFDSEIESETEAQLQLGASSEEEDDQEDVDFVVDEEDDQVSFITDLFQRPAEDSNLCLGLALGFGQIDEDMDDWDPSNRAILGVGIERNDVTSDVDLELGLGLGADNRGEFGKGTSAGPEPKPSEFASVSGQELSFLGGLRAVDIDSESDSDQNVVFDSQLRSEFDEIDRMERIGDFDHPPFCWDYLGFNQQQNDITRFDLQEEEEDDEEDDEEEEVYDHDWEFEASSIVIDPLVEADAVLFDWYRDRDDNEADLVSIHTDLEEDRDFEEAFQGLEWEILFGVNNLNRDFDDDDTMFGVVEESMNEWRGNPPASKSVIEALPVVHLSREELKENKVTCAICWSEIAAKEPVRQLPCRHYYHGDCIMPWLGLRNTCPVCRYELPTDDLEYECEKREMDGLNGGGGYSEDLLVSYENFRVFL